MEVRILQRDFRPGVLGGDEDVDSIEVPYIAASFKFYPIILLL